MAKKITGVNKNRELLRTFKELTGLSLSALAKGMGKRVQNMSQYLNGGLNPGNTMLLSGLRHFYEWDVEEDQVMLPVAEITKLSREPGIYFFYDSAGHCIYIGKAANLYTEVGSRLTTKKLRYPLRLDRKLTAKTHKVKEVAAYVTSVIVPSARVRHNLETLLLRTMINGTHNSILGSYR
ncbi:MAG: hypothetical protein KDC03_19580 [Flavobacteriales bacterium]|nr:hypothetical protein [Flavobacteriales bacterium]